jgi:hypothetical protein
VDRRKFTAMAAAGAALGSGGAKAETASWRSQLIGTWSLQEAETVTDGKVAPWMGRLPPITGALMYQPDGWMSTQIAGAKAAVASRAIFNHLPDAERLKTLSSYYAFFGTFEVEEAGPFVTHRVVDALWPDEKGAVLRRSFQIEGGIMRLTTPPIPSEEGHTTFFNRLVWKKIG